MSRFYKRNHMEQAAMLQQDLVDGSRNDKCWSQVSEFLVSVIIGMRGAWHWGEEVVGFSAAMGGTSGEGVEGGGVWAGEMEGGSDGGIVDDDDQAGSSGKSWRWAIEGRGKFWKS
ncbi:hypothetical protein O181_084626 [Austropuccinia psidii MF-1]|uniref:Uncharacterized protein n=1 Tax=Austropuccinia psidii MF-1 TaxID=1389203 RepID=A0A9Q3FWV6_9BASI|nr:hypothetical protein [Austropuccinia psidii MF-1]